MKLTNVEMREYKYGAGLKLSFISHEDEQCHTVIFKNSYYFSFAQTLSVGTDCNMKAVIKQENEKHFLVDVFSVNNTPNRIIICISFGIKLDIIYSDVIINQHMWKSGHYIMWEM